MTVMALLLSGLSVGEVAEAAGSGLVEQGRRIYEEGILTSGAILKGRQADQLTVEGKNAACTTCHRRSGMGGIEGNVSVPPISGRFLFATDESPLALLDIRSPREITRAHVPYTEATLAKAIMNGTNISGKPMGPLMPRYKMSNADVKALTAYLKQLSSQLSPGVTDTSVRFATIIAPDVDPGRADVLQKMMRNAFQQRNFSEQPRSGQMRMPLQLIPRKLRNWELTVWELKGKPETWGSQLGDYYAKDPVFAVISGASNGTWEPVHQFCNAQKLPCLFPSIDLPDQNQTFYSIYFSRGVALEADVLAKYLRESTQAKPQHVFQVFRDDFVGRGGAAELKQALTGSGIAVEDRMFNPEKPEAALEGIAAGDTVMVWLRPDDLALLSKTTPKLPGTVFFSGRLSGDDATVFPSVWKADARLVYPYELGDKRKFNTRVLQQWLKNFNYPLVNETFQTEVFFNLLFLTDLTTQMLDNYYRDYLIERAEDMLTQDSNVTSYPRLGIAVGQRFASKGAYIVRFGDGDQLKAETDWIVP